MLIGFQANTMSKAPPAQQALQIEQQRVRAELKARLFGIAPEPIYVERFEIRRRLGAGAMGVVYAAFDPKLQREVALKILNSVSPGERDPLLHEAQALARLSHPNVLQVYEVGLFQGAPYIVSELVVGGTLRAWLNESTPRPALRVLRLLIDAGRGLLAAHQRGLIHRDIKPENVLIGVDERPRVADFGLAGSLGAAPISITHPSGASGQVVGTLRYMAPEQMRGERSDPLSDQFSFCFMAFEVLFDRLPFGDDTSLVAIDAGVLVQVLDDHPAQPVLPVLRRGLCASPQGRFPSMVELLAALDEVARLLSKKEAVASATNHEQPYQAPPFVSGHRPRAAAGVVLFGVLALGAGLRETVGLFGQPSEIVPVGSFAPAPSTSVQVASSAISLPAPRGSVPLSSAVAVAVPSPSASATPRATPRAAPLAGARPSPASSTPQRDRIDAVSSSRK